MRCAIHKLYLLLPLLLVGCGSVTRPNTDLCIASAPGKVLLCYNLRADYDDEGNLKPGTQPKLKPFEKIEDVNKFIVTDPDGYANLIAYIQKLRDRVQPSALEARH